MTASDVEWEFGVEFPTKSSSKPTTSKSSTRSRNRKKPPIPKGASQRLEKSTRYMHGRLQELFTYRCPSNTCDFIVRRSFNKEGALKTLMTHLGTDHRKSK